MTKVSQEDIQYLGRLAKIELSANEILRMGEELSAVLDYVAKLSKTNTKGIAATSQVTGLTDVWRKDEVRQSKPTPQELLKNAPATKDGYLKVKRVL